jgi:hypothetical protein
MNKTITVTHHAAKREYQWEFVIPEGPTVLLREENVEKAMETLGLEGNGPTLAELRALPNGGSQSIDANVSEGEVRRLEGLAVKAVNT